MNSARITALVDPWIHRVGPRTLQVMAGLLWLSNVSWKVPTTFGRGDETCRSLCRYIEEGIDHPVLPGSSWVFEHVFSPNVEVFGWTTVFVEATLAALLLSGVFPRTAGFLGIAQSAGILLAVANAPEEWYWSYFLMIGLHVAILVSAPTLRPFSLRTIGFATTGYGVVVALAHAGAGLTGDGNKDFSLFSQRNDFPGDWGRNVFPGSIALGALFVIAGIAVAMGAPKVPALMQRRLGVVTLIAAAILLLTYRSTGTVIELGAKSSSAAVIAAVGLALLVSGAATARADAAPRLLP